MTNLVLTSSNFSVELKGHFVACILDSVFTCSATQSKNTRVLGWTMP